ncbi:uncharacterized protein TRAVEDRAFT_27447 [Trametes versicolor FP-101664 SS1]|uniref:uncharacterized protein n=1 Tax=Trametes versicolor (strain FP-101664) TaxID=717944 RepID=UPI0004622E10|nr:uncharacterized protein TRAVEDRAFT_27447 [Trametes versicolor FP-101664 SS1]EIW62062.1 hypothetical protein TRAVEDRAFT_27447 [Trametes versicolor FP-101664 SS1]
MVRERQAPEIRTGRSPALDGAAMGKNAGKLKNVLLDLHWADTRYANHHESDAAAFSGLSLLTSVAL